MAFSKRPFYVIAFFFVPLRLRRITFMAVVPTRVNIQASQRTVLKWKTSLGGLPVRVCKNKSNRAFNQC